MATTALVGTRLPRIEGSAKVTGQLRYACDIYLPRMAHAKVLRSPYANAKILKIDTSKAEVYPGVVAVITAKDIPNLPREATSRGRALLAYDETIFYGQPVAAVVAEAASIAEEALDLIKVEYQPLPVVVDPVLAMQPGSPQARVPLGGEVEGAADVDIEREITGEAERKESPNITQHLVFERGDIEKGFAEADLVVERTYRSSWVHQGYIEPHNAIVDYDISGQFTVYSSNRGQFPLRTSLSQILAVPETKIRVVPLEPGGAFGSKIAPLTEGLAAVLTRHVRRPVKLVMSRSEDLKAAIPAPPAVIQLKTGVKKDGALTAVKANIIFDSGAFPGGPVLGACNVMGGYYKFPNLEVHGYEVLTNKPSTGALRAPGQPQATFALESQMDIMARELGLDPVGFRMKNAIEAGDLLINNQPSPSIGLKECLKQASETPLWKRRHNLPKNHGVGIAIGGRPQGAQPSGAVITLNGDGTISVAVGSIDVTGVNTSFTQIAADSMGLPVSSVYVSTADSRSAPYSGQSGGSKVLRTVGHAIQLAAQDALEQMYKVVAGVLECNPGDLEAGDGKIRVKGSPDRAIGLDLVATMTNSMGSTHPPIVGRGNAPASPQAPGYACQVVEVEVDPDTGQVTLVDAVCVQDAGFAVNPLSVEGQLQGGMVQSLAIGVSEELMYNDNGVLMNPSLLDYRMLTALDVPRITPVIVEVPSTDPLFGVRGVGEPCIIPGAAAVANAVHDAIGARGYKLPLTAERVLDAMGKLG